MALKTGRIRSIDAPVVKVQPAKAVVKGVSFFGPTTHMFMPMLIVSAIFLTTVPVIAILRARERGALDALSHQSNVLAVGGEAFF